MKYTLEELNKKKKEYVGFDYEDPEQCLKAVMLSGMALGYVKEQTPDICLAAVKRNGLALEYVKEQTEEICLSAVKQNGYSLRYVKDLSILEDIYL